MQTNILWQKLTSAKQRLEADWVSPPTLAKAQNQKLKTAFGTVIPADILALLESCIGAGKLWQQPVAPTVGGSNDADRDPWFDYGCVDFLTLNEMIAEHERCVAIAENCEPPSDTRRAVRVQFFERHWIPFASDASTGRFAIDLNPAKGGIKGQILWIFDEGGMVGVIANSLAEFLEYGLECLRYEIGELLVVPVLPISSEKSERNDLVSPAQHAINLLWDEIIRLNKLRRPLIKSGADEPRFGKPISIEQVAFLGKHLKVVLPDVVKFSLLKVKDVVSPWRRIDSRDPEQMVLLMPQIMNQQNGRVLRDFKRGQIDCSDAKLLDALKLGSDFVFLGNLMFCANSGSWRVPRFYIICGNAPVGMSGLVCQLLENEDGSNSTLTFYADSFEAMLEKGVSLLRTELDTAGIQYSAPEVPMSF
jgi:hypothetical protein